MTQTKQAQMESSRILVKLRRPATLKAAESHVRLRPLYETGQGHAATLGMTDGSQGLGAEPQWWIADSPDGGANPWDMAHGRLAAQLGVDESDIVFAEPDLVQSQFPGEVNDSIKGPFSIGENCEATPQDGAQGKVLGPDVFAWHLGNEYTQLARASSTVNFSQPRTRIAHLDTGYYGKHVTLPSHLAHGLERNFVLRDGQESSAEDPDNRVLLFDSSGHGPGTLGILAGGKVPGFGDKELGGAPNAEVVPLRIADSVVLWHTSAFARALSYAIDINCDVATMSMGGLPSRAWREAVDSAYLAGLCVVAAAGNNTNGLPTRHIVYPARYGRVIAVCGVMANGQPYAGLGGSAMEGNFGPSSHMGSAIAAYTPNIPWARFGCPDAIRLNGEGTSAATPQVAAAVALWLERYKSDLPRDWRRIEAVRHALFSTARNENKDERLGRGILKAFDALGVPPRFGLSQTPSDNDSFAFWRVLTGLGISEIPCREQMFNLELSQRWLMNPDLQAIVPDPDAATQLDNAQLKRLMDAIIADEGASVALRKQVALRYPLAAGRPAPQVNASKNITPGTFAACDLPPSMRTPSYRRLRVYAVDPSFSASLDTADINEVTLKVRWEKIKTTAVPHTDKNGDKTGPLGEYLAIDDLDANGTTRYEPVDLNACELLAQDGWPPADGNAKFHQQMVYAVAMKTIGHFEAALGRPVLWRHRENTQKKNDDSVFVRRLAIHPHGLCEANAYYSPQEVALKFGYFDAGADSPAHQVPGSRVYTCLSHDIIAHETTHAVLDGMFRHFNEPSNPDVLALHEAFADIVALMQHFTIPEILESQIARTRGDLEAESMLGSLAVQFGRARGGHGALREAIGRVENGVWKRSVPDPSQLQKQLTPHARGAILVAAVFDAFIAIYKTRVADLLRIYTSGTGVLPEGAIHPDLVRRLAMEAAKSARHVLTMCIRALDYLPPVDVTFFEYLRALITADYDVMRDDRYNYRLAFAESFRRRGIYPVNIGQPSEDTVRTLSVDTLRWRGIDFSNFSPDMLQKLEGLITGLKTFADNCLYLKDRKRLFNAARAERLALHCQLEDAFAALPQFATELGLEIKAGKSFKVHELRPAMRSSPDGRSLPQVIVSLTQSVIVSAAPQTRTPAFKFRGGATLVVDLTVPEVKYVIFKRIENAERQNRTAEFVRGAAADPLQALFFGPDRPEPFAALHALADDHA